MNKSFIVTGASASGKTTLIEFARKKGYIFLPTHTSRNARNNEINGIDIVSISKKLFIENFNNEIYLEPTLDSCELKGVSIYYGTPKDWIEKLKNNNYCGAPSSPITARKIKNELNIIWVHLYCDDIDRYKRLKNRGMDDEEIKARMNNGDSLVIPTDATILINTSKYTPEEIMKIIEFKDKGEKTSGE